VYTILNHSGDFRAAASDLAKRGYGTAQGGEPNVESKTFNKVSTLNFGPITFTGKAAPPPRQWLIQDVLPETHPGLIHGEGGTSKSYFALAAALHVASGRRFLGKSVIQRPVGYLDFELDEAEQLRRALAVARGMGLPDVPEAFAYFQCAGYALTDVAPALAAWLRAYPGGVFVLDSFGAASTGNIKAEEIVIGAMRELRALGAGGILVLDHQSKLQTGEDYANKGAYGSVYKVNLSRVVWQMELVDSVPGSATILLRNKKNNFGPKLPDMGLETKFDNASGNITLTLADVTQGALATRVHLDVRIKEAIKNSEGARATSKSIADDLDANPTSVKTRLSVLKGRGDVIEVGKVGREVEWGIASRREES
jgi:hypothetical protein